MDDNKIKFQIDRNIIKTFFKQYIEDSRNSLDIKIQQILNLISSFKEENEKFITKSK